MTRKSVSLVIAAAIAAVLSTASVVPALDAGLTDQSFIPYRAVGAVRPSMSDAYVSWWDGGDSGSQNWLRVMNLQTGAVSTARYLHVMPVPESTRSDRDLFTWADGDDIKGDTADDDLFVYDAPRAVLTKLGRLVTFDGDYQNTSDDSLPDISGSRIVVSGRHSGQTGVWLVDITNASWRPISGTGGRPAIDGDRIAWIERGEGSDGSNLVLFNLATSERRVIATGPGIVEVDVDPSRIVWSEYAYMQPSRIRSYDLATGAISEVFSTERVVSELSLSAGVLTWLESPGYDQPAGTTIHLRTLSTGAEQVIQSAGAELGGAATNGSSVAWMVGKWDAAAVRLATLSARASTSITFTIPPVVTWGSSTKGTGRLVDGAGGPLANRTIRVSRATSDVFGELPPMRSFATVKTDSNGAFTFTVKPIMKTGYSVDFIPAQSDTFAPSSTGLSVVAPKVELRLYVAKNARAHKWLAIYSAAHFPPSTDAQPELHGERRLSNGTWKEQYVFSGMPYSGWGYLPRSLKATGLKSWKWYEDRAFITELYLLKPGKWRFRSVMAEPAYARSESAWKYVTVR